MRRETLSLHSSDLPTLSLPPLLQDRDVRKAVLSFFQAYLDGVSTDNISPFFSSMMAHAKSAMTHILEEIRLHGVKFLDVFMETHPALVLRHSEKIIPNYLSLLSQPMSKGSSKSLLYE